jgi:hypothetical protein
VVRPDLVAFANERPVAVFEVKARAAPAGLRTAALEQLKHVARDVRSPWAVLVDPHGATIYRFDTQMNPIGFVEAEELLRAAGLSAFDQVGEEVLVFAISEWIESMRDDAEFVQRHPELREFADALRAADSTVLEPPID